MPDSQTELLSEILEKMIDCQMANTQALTSLKSIVDENNNKVKIISAHFTNGFRSEIKEHITKEIKKHVTSEECMIGLLKDLKKEVMAFKTLGFWFKVIVSFVVAFGALAVAIVKILDVIEP